MKAITSIIIFFIASGVFSQVQEWNWHDGGYGTTDYSVDCIVDASGNIIVTGNRKYGLNYDIRTMKFTPTGDTLWTRRYNGTYNSNDGAFAMTTDASGNIFIAGYSGDGSGGQDFLLLKYNASGTLVFASTNDVGAADSYRAITLDNTGNIYVCGPGGESGNLYFIMHKYNSSGVFLWDILGDPVNSPDIPFSIYADNRGNILSCGTTLSFSTTYYFTCKYRASDGLLKWNRVYNTNSNDAEARIVKTDNTGGVYVTGHCHNAADITTINTIKYDSLGNLVFSKTYTSQYPTFAMASQMELDASGNIFVGGISGSNGSEYSGDFRIIKYNSSGNLEWTASYNSPADSGDDLNKMILDASGNIYAAGKSYTAGGKFDYSVVKFDQNGNRLWSTIYDRAGGYDEASGLGIDNTGNIYVTGKSYDPGSNSVSRSVTLKYSQIPAAPVLLSPANNSSGVLLTDTLEWNKTFASVYHLQLSTDSLFSSYIVNDSLVSDTLKIVSGLTAGTDYWWRVKGKNAYGTGAWSGKFKFTTTSLTSVIIPNGSIPDKYALYNNYPNPFNPVTTILFHIPLSGGVSEGRGVLTSLIVYDLLGREVKTLINQNLQPGKYSVSFDGGNLASGVYFYRLESGSFSDIKKMLMIK